MVELETEHERKNASGGSGDVGSEPQSGKRNGAAPLQGNSSEGKDTTNPSKGKARGKDKVKPEQQVGDLFAGLLDKEEDNGLQRNDDAARAEAVPTDNR